MISKVSSITTILAILASAAAAEEVFIPPIGFGAQRLKNHRSRGAVLKASTSCENVDEYYFKEAVVDNFAATADQKYWEGNGQRYWINKEFWGGEDFPIMVFIGGEGQESCSRLTDRMYAYNLAKDHHALMLNVEHRFYGESYPTADMTTENLKYLSSAQALADLARLIGYVKSDLGSPNSQVITIGGSYPGNLAAWFRLKYPSVSQGSIASSAPVTAQTNFPEYMDVVGQSIVYFGGQACYDAFKSAADAVSVLAAQGVGSAGMKTLQTDFETCSDITEDLDVAVFMSDLMGNVQGTIQYNNEHYGTMNVTDICPVMLQSDNAYDNFVALQKLYRTANGQECEDASWADTVAYLSASEKDPTNAGRPWTYQTCNEFGYYQTTDSQNQPFSSWKWLQGLDFSRAICAAAFNGWTTDPEVDWINQVYGDVRISGTNIAFAAGTIDPWHALGVTNYTTALPQSSEEPVFIEGTAHCNDLYAPANSDPASLTYAREVISELVSKWLAK